MIFATEAQFRSAPRRATVANMQDGSVMSERFRLHWQAALLHEIRDALDAGEPTATLVKRLVRGLKRDLERHGDRARRAVEGSAQSQISKALGRAPRRSP